MGRAEVDLICAIYEYTATTFYITIIFGGFEVKKEREWLMWMRIRMEDSRVSNCIQVIRSSTSCNRCKFWITFLKDKHLPGL